MTSTISFIISIVKKKFFFFKNPIPTNKPNVEAKRPPRPVNITPYVKISPTTTNQINVSWCVDFTRHYVISVYLVKKLSSAQLLSGMKTAQKIQPSDATRAMSNFPTIFPIHFSCSKFTILNISFSISLLVKDKLNEDADCEIATTTLNVTLVCPLGKMKMKTPCR